MTGDLLLGRNVQLVIGILQDKNQVDVQPCSRMNGGEKKSVIYG